MNMSKLNIVPILCLLSILLFPIGIQANGENKGKSIRAQLNRIENFLNDGFTTKDQADFRLFAALTGLAGNPFGDLGLYDDNGAEICSNFVDLRWSDYSDTANQVCVAAATGELSDCVADADASLEEKHVYWSSCIFGRMISERHLESEFLLNAVQDALDKWVERGAPVYTVPLPCPDC